MANHPCRGEVREARFAPTPYRAGMGDSTKILRVNRWNGLVNFVFASENTIYPGGRGHQEAFLNSSQAREVAGMLLKAADEAENLVAGENEGEAKMKNLSEMPWETLRIGDRLISATGVGGAIKDLLEVPCDRHRSISILWDNGNESLVFHHQANAVLIAMLGG